MKRWIVFWSIQDPSINPPWPVCAGHRDAKKAPLEATRPQWEDSGVTLEVREVTDGKCALGAFGNCCDDPVECVPVLDVGLLEESS